jgi:diguanylate cyclase (GGDEF)-like protein/PAS domain S-box-containing protein
VLCTAYSDYSWDEINLRFGAADRLLILKKPYDTIEVCQLASALSKKWHLARHAHLKLNQLKGMVAEQTRELQKTNDELLLEIQRHAEAENRYRLAETGANDGLWDWDLRAGSVYFSPRWKAMLGYSEDQIGSSPDEWFRRVHSDDLAALKAACDAHFSGKTEQLRGECRLLHNDGQYRWMLYRGVAIKDDQGTVIRAAGSFTDITERKMAEEQLRFEALHDALTGLANRVKLSDRIGDAICRLKRDPNRRFAVMFLDLDRFKVINDSLGHLIGDKFLVEIARRLSNFIRAGDELMQTCRDDVARLGGDEFVLVIDGIVRDSDVLRVAQRLHEAVAEPIVIDGHSLHSAVSIGIAIANQNYNNVTEILRDADTALYQAKAGGRSCTRIFDPEMHHKAMAQWRTESELRAAIDNHELRVFYQPVVTSNGSLVSIEALVRWQHPQRGLLDPDQFLPVAEESDLIVRIGRWVALEACRQVRMWQTKFPRHKDLPVSVNMSSKQFSLPGFVDEVSQTLARAGLAPQSLRLEITETVAMRDAHATVQTLLRLRAMGVLIDVDDFGTGYSSLSYLHRMPINALKIDRSFVSSIFDDKVSAHIVHAITLLAHSLQVDVIAEGVETIPLFSAVRTMGCDYFQGYCIARPMSAADMELYLADAKALDPGDSRRNQATVESSSAA